MGKEHRIRPVCTIPTSPPEADVEADIPNRRFVPNPEVGTTRLPGSNWSSGRPYLCNGDAKDREQPTDNQLWGHMVAKEQHARNYGEHRKQQAKWCDAAHGATGDQPEPKAKSNDSSDENSSSASSRESNSAGLSQARRDKACGIKPPVISNTSLQPAIS